MSPISSKYPSQVNPKFEYSSSVWLASMQSVKYHSRIILEGVIDGQKFRGRYELCNFMDTANVVGGVFQKKIGNIPGVIDSINVVEEADDVQDHREYEASYSSKSWFVSPARAQTMIAKIKEEQAVIAREKEEYERNGDIRVFTHLYQCAGSARSLILGGNGGENCVTWAEKMLAIADAGNGVKPIDSIKAAPQAHVMFKVSWRTIFFTIITASAIAAKLLKR